ncbi:M48 family metallopeptidase [Achromobacter aloeverae]|uniref:Zn-dependent protease with chaperone function n=1 Tax=Achromobacter aloeverae TaxID=1750518 RepID=A0A4Q1HKD0_9BURK|nr:M48 family metallopeptidase [Achromobacter aloeverae]RXN90580.1 Zn-dependent protease with chaperone function [Achromobacter aloeverae]
MSTLPDSLPPGFPATSSPPRPTRAYRNRAWIAVGGLLVFMVLYLGLAGWLVYTAYRMLAGAISSSTGDGAFLGYAVGACAAFLAAFMLKGLFFVKRGSIDDEYEVKADTQPELFAFLRAMADAAGAPRPHRVFLSSRVNASVSYDLSVLNLLLPSRKNLEIGLGLVNVLTLGELRAVLAHEFGHFAQRSMAVGRWVYIAQQVAGHLVARRDRFDRFLQSISNSDFRIAWVGWLISLIVWAIRALVDSAFRVVVLMQRALSREMELNADLVAVHLTGSDALVHALHRLQAADDSWDRALRFAFNEKGDGHPPADIFAVQTRILAHMRRILNDRTYGVVDPVPADNPAAHRVFTAGLAQPPRMWLTHPLNHEREANAKANYVPSPVEEGSAWDLFRDAGALRLRLTEVTLGPKDKDAAEPEVLDVTLQRLDEQFNREYLDSRYRGIYFGRSPVRHTADAAALFDPSASADPAVHAGLYPASLTQDMEELRALELDIDQLRGLSEGDLKVDGGKIRHRGGEASLSELPSLLQSAQRTLDTVRGRLRDHDHACRGWHLAAARAAGPAWAAYLEGVLRALHFADHAEANLRDANAAFRSWISVETAARRVSNGGRKRVLAAAKDLYATLQQTYAKAAEVQLNPRLAAATNIEDFPKELGAFELTEPTAKNLGSWIDVIDGWVDTATGMLGALRSRALDELLLTESRVAAHALQQAPLDAAETPPRVPVSYSTLLPGQERQRQTKLNWWSRFLVADGIFPSVLRLAVAGSIVAVVLGVSMFLGNATLTIYNGLGQPVMVSIGDSWRVQVPAHGDVSHTMKPGAAYTVETRTLKGDVIESFNADIDNRFSHVVYNVAGASPLVEWTAAYGNASQRPPVRHGAPRWSTISVDYFFRDPPGSVKTKGGGATRTALEGGGDGSPEELLRLVPSQDERAAMMLAHARWDPPINPHSMQWLVAAAGVPGFDEVLAQRLRLAPRDVMLNRLRQDTTTGAQHDAVCKDLVQQAQANPADGDAQYLAVRCMPDSPAKDQAFVDGNKRWPQQAWFANAAGNIAATKGDWATAEPRLLIGYTKLPMMQPAIASELARVMRAGGRPDPFRMEELVSHSRELSTLRALETGQGLTQRPDLQAFSALAQGRLEVAAGLAHQKPETEARILRLVGASEGASPAAVERALALPGGEGLDEDTIWTSIALAARSKRDYAPLMAQVPDALQRYKPAMKQFLDAVQQKRPAATAEQALDGLPPAMRGQAYAMATVLLGKDTPPAWRRGALTLLFGPERPYFKS